MEEPAVMSSSRTRSIANSHEPGRPPKRPRQEHVAPRVSRACDRCKARKTRCSGTWPCVFCSHLSLECQFTAVHRRRAGNPPQKQASVNVEDTGQRSNSNDDRDVTSPLTPNATDSLLLEMPPDAPSHATPKATAQPLRSTRNSPEPAQTDQQGHYVGPASGVSFLLRIQRKLQSQSSSGRLNASMFNFGDRPLPSQDSNFVILPEKPLAESMLQRYFDFAATTHRFLHRPSVEAWLGELYETGGSMRCQETARSRTALLFMVFAHANNYRGKLTADTKDGIAESAETSARYFAVAEHQLSMDKGEIQLASVQARLAQCFYLLAQSRLNHCWTLFGITAHLILALGMHRKSRDKPSSRVNHVELECRKRTFWCAYNLNAYLSTALGRPMTFHDDDIDQELPLCVDDERLRPSCSVPPTVHGPSITTATVAQIKLSRIVARILRTLYGIHPPSTDHHLKLAAEFTRDLSQWREHISYLLDTDGDSAIFVKLVLRQRDVLNLAFWHAEILVHRPFLLKNFSILESHGVNSEPSSSRRQEMQRNIGTSIEAAVQITEHIDRIDAAGEFYSTLFFIPYFGFSAIVILYVYAIQQRAEPPERYLRYFRVASNCHAQLESIAAKGSLMQRYGVVLQELRLEVLRKNAHLASVSTPRAGASLDNGNNLGETEPVQGGRENEAGSQRPGGAEEGPGAREGRNEDTSCQNEGEQGNGEVTDTITISNTDMDDGLAYMASWGQFDALVTGGTGTLDAMLSSDIAHVWDSINTGANGW